MKWTKQDDATLRRMRDDGCPMPLIAERLSTTVGAVVGRASRLNLPKITSGFTKSSRKKAPMLPAQIITFSDPMAKAPDKPKYVAMPIAYAKTCQWIEGDPRKNGGPCFCHGPVYRESWCLTHWDRVHGYSEAAD